jgi:hypothetical protein
LLLGLVTVLSSTSAFAQTASFPKREIAVNYSFISTDILETPEVVPGGRDNVPLGWNAAVTYFLADNLGLSGEVGGHYGRQTLFSGADADLTYHTFLFGPRLVHRDGKVEMFTSMLVGIAQASIKTGGSPAATATDFTMAVGGGVDYVGSRRLGVRILRVDYVVGELYESINNTIRVMSGVTYRW